MLRFKKENINERFEPNASVIREIMHELKDAGNPGIEYTEEDAMNVIDLMRDGMKREAAIDAVLSGIRDTFDYE